MVLLSAVFLGSAGLVMLQGRFVRALSERIAAGGWTAAAPVHAVIRVPAMFVYALARLPGLIRVLAADLTAKWAVALMLLPFFTYSAVLAAINIVHLCGIAFAYPAIARAILLPPVLARP